MKFPEGVLQKDHFPEVLHAKTFSVLRAPCPTTGLEPPGRAERVQRQTVLSSLAIYVLSCGDMENASLSPFPPGTM